MSKEPPIIGIAIAVIILLLCSVVLGYCAGYQNAKKEQADEQERVTIDNLNARIRVLEQDHREGVK